jgi:putative flippase GtrA
VQRNILKDVTTRDLIKLIWTNQILRFAVVGGFTAALDYASLFILVEFYEINHLISAAIGFFIGSTSNYVLSIIFVFEGGKFKSLYTEFFIFIFFTILGLLLNHLIMWLGVDVIKTNYLIIKAISLILVTLFNFLSKKHIVFKR